MKKLFIDCDVLLDVGLGRQPFSRSQTPFGNAFNDAPRHTINEPNISVEQNKNTTRSVVAGIPKQSLGTRNELFINFNLNSSIALIDFFLRQVFPTR
jgi:hypothetical protein